MTRLDVLKEIDDLHDKNCLPCEFYNTDNSQTCRTCPVYEGLQALGVQLMQPKRDKVKILMDKKKDLTKTEVEYLETVGVFQSAIYKKMGISATEYKQFMQRI